MNPRLNILPILLAIGIALHTTTHPGKAPQTPSPVHRLSLSAQALACDSAFVGLHSTLDSVKRFVFPVLMLGAAPTLFGALGAEDRSTSSPIKAWRWEKDLAQPLIDQLSPSDKARLEQIIEASDVELQAIIDEANGSIYVPDSETGDGAARKNGRTVYMQLKQPFVVKGKTIRWLRLKGVRPAFSANGELHAHSGRGKVSKVLDVNAQDRLVFRPGLDEPHGGMLYTSVQNEISAMIWGIQKNIPVDVVVGYGIYKNLLFQEKAVGFFVAGMEDEDYRMARNNYNDKGVAHLKSSTLEILNQKELVLIIYAMGRTMRNMHDHGLFHLFPHPSNFGLFIDQEGFRQIVIRDFEAAKIRLGNQVNLRFVDLIFLIHKFLFHQSEDNNFIRGNSWIIIFLGGYLGQTITFWDSAINQEALYDSVTDPGPNTEIREATLTDFAVQLKNDIANAISPTTSSTSQHILNTAC